MKATYTECCLLWVFVSVETLMLGSSGLVGRSLLPVTVRLASFRSQPVDHQQEYMHKGDRHGKFKWGLWHIGGLCPLKGVSDTHLHLIIATWQWQLTLLYGNHVWSPQSWLCLTSQYWMVRNTFKLFCVCMYDKLCLTALYTQCGPLKLCPLSRSFPSPQICFCWF